MGAQAISNSYGGSETGTSGIEASYNHPGHALTASSGDSGFGVEFPASSPHMTAVGGTTLNHSANARGWTESAWSGAGSGCSRVYAKPAWQTGTRCSRRTIADVSAVADPSTGTPTPARCSTWSAAPTPTAGAGRATCAPRWPATTDRPASAPRTGAAPSDAPPTT